MSRGIKFWKSLSEEDLRTLVLSYPSKTAMAKALGMHGGWLKKFNTDLLSAGAHNPDWHSQPNYYQDSKPANWSRKKVGSDGRHTPRRTEASSAWLTPEMKAQISRKTTENRRKIFEEKTLPFLFVENSKFDSLSARQYVRRWNHHYKWLPYECDVCKNNGEWLGRKLTLQLDHKNGRPRDHRLSNLRFLCPNCHCQTETWGGGNSPKARKKKGFSPRLELSKLPDGYHREAREMIDGSPGRTRTES